MGFSLHGAPPSFDCPLVLRVLHTGGEQNQIATEHAVQNAIAGQGFPAPYVLGSSSTDEELGWPFLVMKFLPGEPDPHLPNAIELQMKALAQLHSLDTEPVEQAMRAHGVPTEQRYGSCRSELAAAQIERWKLDRWRPLLGWLEARTPVAPRLSICHGDPHLYNMLFDNNELTAVIDWGTARLNNPEMDVGLICGYARCGRHPSSVEENPQQRVVDRVIAAYERYGTINHEIVLYFETEFLVSVLVDMADRHIRRIAGEDVARNPLLDHPSTAEIVRARLQVVLDTYIPTPEEAATG